MFSFFKIWYSRFYRSRYTEDPADPHWFVVVVLPSQVFLVTYCVCPAMVKQSRLSCLVSCCRSTKRNDHRAVIT